MEVIQFSLFQQFSNKATVSSSSFLNKNSFPGHLPLRTIKMRKRNLQKILWRMISADASPRLLTIINSTILWQMPPYFHQDTMYRNNLKNLHLVIIAISFCMVITNLRLIWKILSKFHIQYPFQDFGVNECTDGIHDIPHMRCFAHIMRSDSAEEML